MTFKKSTGIYIMFLVSLLLLAGCGSSDDEIRVYQVSRPDSMPPSETAPRPAMAPTADAPTQPKGPSQATPSGQGGMQMLPGMDSQVEQISDATWTAPEGWEEFPPNPPRKGNFNIQREGSDAVLATVTAFPGTVGGLLANVNRWRGEVGLEPLREDQLEGLLKTVYVDGRTAYIVDLTREHSGAGVNSTLGAIIPRDDSTWFVKIMGDSAVLATQVPKLKEFMESMQFPY